MADEFTYDVAFSFLGQDESLAVQLNESLKDRYKTFIYSDAKRQERLAGRDGADAFGRVFGVEAKQVVVFYREGWGDRGFTEIEGTAIRNRAHEFGWEFATFIPLDDPPTAPRWLPRARLWIHLKRYGVEGAAAVIESRLQETWEAPKELTVAEAAARLIAERQESQTRAAFLNSVDGVTAARSEFEVLYEEVKRACAESSGILALCPQRERVSFCMQTPGTSRKLTFYFDLTVNNSLCGFKLTLIDYHHNSASERDYNHRTDFHFDFGPFGEYGWRSGTTQGKGDFFTTRRFADDQAKRMIDALSNRQRPPTFLIW